MGNKYSCVTRYMRAATQFALDLRSHDFGLVGKEGSSSRDAPSPKLSKGGQYYFDCRNCGRTVFDNGTGSATQSDCRR